LEGVGSLEMMDNLSQALVDTACKVSDVASIQMAYYLLEHGWYKQKGIWVMIDQLSLDLMDNIFCS
jgi:hypothetical protein